MVPRIRNSENTQIAGSESTYRRSDDTTGSDREKLDAGMGVPLPERGVGLDSVALAHFESVRIHNVRGLAYQLAAKQCKTPDRKLSARILCSCLGTLGGKRALPGYDGELIWVENQSQMVRTCNHAAYGRLLSIDLCGARGFLREPAAASCAGAGK